MTEAFSRVEAQRRAVDPERLGLLLRESGWQLVGYREGSYLRLAPQDDSRQSVLVPLDRQAPEFAISLNAALVDVERIAGREAWNSSLAARLTTDPTDGFRFRKESAAPRGLIAWTQGEQLIASARAALTAGAKTFMGQQRHFSNRFGQFANRYLDTVLMGQTAPGSYVVTAFAPTRAFVSLSGAAAANESLFNDTLNAASTRDIGIAIVKALEATVEAVEHYRGTGSLAAFNDLVPRGVSYEMTSALWGLAQNSDGADIVVEWDPAEPVPTQVTTAHFQLQPSDADVLDRAAAQLAATDEESTHVTVVGRVHLLTKSQAGGPGVVGIDNLSSPSPRKVRARLSPDDYHRAVGAHDEDRAVVVVGRLEREGNLHWLYDSQLVDVLGSVDELNAFSQRQDVAGYEIEGQLAGFVVDEDLPS